MPVISIITINRNNAGGLRRTIESVINQTFKDYEYIIIDGASTDGSLDVIQHYAPKFTYWVSEPDTGIYNAMNKGIQYANGEYLLMLNSGDTLFSTETLEVLFSNSFSEDIVYGNVNWEFNSNGVSGIFPDHLTLWYFLEASIGHQAALIKRKLHSIAGLYREDYSIVADWCFFIDCLFKHNASSKKVDMIISNCPRDGVSTQPQNWSLVKAEREKFLSNHYSNLRTELMNYSDKYWPNEKDPFTAKDQQISNQKISLINQIRQITIRTGSITSSLINIFYRKIFKKIS